MANDYNNNVTIQQLSQEKANPKQQHEIETITTELSSKDLAQPQETNEYIIRNIYDEFNESTFNRWYHSNGGQRTGSTILYNLLRILIRDKIDPNVYSGYTVNLGNKYSKMNFAIVNKRHGPCKGIGGKIFLAHRNVSHQLCSALKMGFYRSIGKDGKSVINYCNKMWSNYQSCLKNPSLVYDMNYHVMIENITKIIEDIAIVLNIRHVMDEYDYDKIADELSHLRPTKNMKGDSHAPEHPITQIHANHITDNSKKQCDRDQVVRFIQNDQDCKTFYDYVNDLLIKGQ